MANLEIKVLHDLPGILVLEIAGAMDTSTFTRMMEVANPYLERGVKRFVLEVSRLSYVNSLGLAWLYKNAEECGRAGGGIVLVKCPKKVKGVLDALGMAAEFRFAEGLEVGLWIFKVALPKPAVPVPTPDPGPSPRIAPASTATPPPPSPIPPPPRRTPDEPPPLPTDA